MLKSILLAGVLAATAIPAISVAQPDQGYNNGDGYNDRDGGYNDNSDNDSGSYDNNRDDRYSNPDDHAYNDDNGGYYSRQYHRYYNNDNDDHSYGGRVFTGRVGSTWWDQGRRCQWREVTWRDRQGDPAYKWVTVCDN